MLFNSIHFLIFFPIVVALYFACPYRWRWALLLAASYYFYACAKLAYVPLLFVSSLNDYIAALLIERQPQGSPWRKLFLACSLSVNFGLLFFFKYYDTVALGIEEILHAAGILIELPLAQMVLPVGISFYTFQTVSYSIDVYRGHQKAERHLGIFLLYVSFFPQLVAGPIERSTSLLPQFYRKNDYDPTRIRDGFLYILMGLFKKLVIADMLALYPDQVHAHPENFAGIAALLASYAFAIQIYCDFSGYSDIARGTARVMGYDLRLNFDRPFFSRSTAEFWRRWHISLFTWFRDYIYLPMGGNRVSIHRWAFNLGFVFAVSGLWHGASWTYISWGLITAAYIIIGRYTLPLRNWINERTGILHYPRLHAWLQRIIVFHLFAFSELCIRAYKIQDAYHIFKSIWTPSAFTLDMALAPLHAVPGIANSVAFATLAAAILLIAEWLQERRPLLPWITAWPLPLRWALYYAMIVCIVIFGVLDTPRPFIYFQF